MPTIRTVQRRIKKIEGFNVIITYKNGKDVMDNKRVPKQYPLIMASKDCTVLTWKKNRFYPNYPGYDVRVLFSNDEIAHGGKLLSTVRETYLEE